jgi:cell division protein FtsL
MFPAIRHDLLMMGRVVLWLLFMLVMTPIAAVILHAMARVVWGLDLE